MSALASETTKLLAKDGCGIELLIVPHYEALYDTTSPVPTLNDSRIAAQSMDQVNIILHSSGTSAFPKPIRLSGHNYKSWCISFCQYISIL